MDLEFAAALSPVQFAAAHPLKEVVMHEIIVVASPIFAVAVLLGLWWALRLETPAGRHRPARLKVPTQDRR
jgi:hypothetical protein